MDSDFLQLKYVAGFEILLSDFLFYHVVNNSILYVYWNSTRSDLNNVIVKIRKYKKTIRI